MAIKVQAEWQVPAQLNIGGIAYRVLLVDEVSEETPAARGMILYEKQEIRIKKGLGPQVISATLLHEILHGIFELYSLDEDEPLIERISNGLYQVLHDNALLF